MSELNKRSPEIRQQLVDWADENGFVVTRDDEDGAINGQWIFGPVHLAKGEIGFEVIVEDGFAYVHGEMSLSGVGTNIEDLADLTTAINDLRLAKGI